MENNLDLYRAKLPYPPIVVVKPNKHYAEIIQTSFAGAVSEFSAISQYIYHHLRTEDQYPEISKALESIAIVEMYHLEILGKLIIKLGGNPGYWINKISIIDRIILDEEVHIQILTELSKKYLTP